MATTEQYLNKLIEQKNTLADNLVEKGVAATHDETLETLVPKVLDITSGGGGIYPVGEDGRPTGEVTVPEGVISLYQYIFQDDNNITGVSLPSTLTKFSTSAFARCKNLKTIKIPEKCTSIASNCFHSCSNLEDVTLPSLLTDIGSYSFYQCTKLKTINIPKTCSSIGGYSFFGCSALGNITIADETSLTINSYAFQRSGIVDKDVENLLSHSTNLYDSIFYACPNLIELDIKWASPSMFSSCPNLTSVKVNMPYVYGGKTGTNVFSNCKKLKKVELNEEGQFTAINGNFVSGCSVLETFNIPSSVTSIENSAFKDCTSLETISIPNGVTTIGSSVFSGCSKLRVVFFPSSISSSSQSCFISTGNSHVLYNCAALEDVQLGEDWNLSFKLDISDNITVDSMVAMFNNLKDLTGETAKTLTLGSTNLAKLTDEQKAIATNKNWTLA